MATHPSRLLALAIFAAVAVTAGASGWAKPPPAGDTAAQTETPIDTVTVIGRRPMDQEMIRTVIAPFVKLHAARDRNSGLLVREAPAGVCPLTLGLPAAFDDFVTARIVSVARSIAAPVQQIGRCEPNVEVLFTGDPQSVVNGLARKTQGEILGFHYVHEVQGLIHVSRPIQAWYITGTVGDPTSDARVVGAGGAHSHGRAIVDRARGPSPFTGTGSLLPPRNSSQIMNALIVVDLRKVAGQQIGPISDYIAMLALSQAQSLDGCSPLPSILDLMSAACPSRPSPQSLTDGDTAFLKALYAADITTSATAAQSRVETGMAKGLDAPKP